MEGEEPSALVEGEFAPLFGQSASRSNTDRRPVEYGQASRSDTEGRPLQTHGAHPWYIVGVPWYAVSVPLGNNGPWIGHTRRSVQTKRSVGTPYTAY